MNEDVKEVEVSAVLGKLSLFKKAFEDTIVGAALVAGAAQRAFICLSHVIFLHVQMTCQLLLNYTRHLDQSGQCQR